MNVAQARDHLRQGNEHVFLKIKIADGSFVDERSSITIWDDTNKLLYAINLPENTQLDTVYAYNSSVPIDKALYSSKLKSDSWIYMVRCFDYDAIVGMQAVYNKELTESFIDTTATGEVLDTVKEQFDRLTKKLDRVETYLTGDYSNTDKDYESNIY